MALKAMVPGTSLVTVVPEHVLHPIASDPVRGCSFFLPNGGPSFGDRLTGRDLVDAMVVALSQYAEIQRTMTGHTGDLIDLGLFDLRPDGLPDRYRKSLLGPQSAPYVDDLIDVESDILAWTQLLSGSPVQASIEHNVLHLGTSSASNAAAVGWTQRSQS